MNTITEETRRDSYKSIDKQTRYNLIMGCIGTEEMTARMIAYALGYSDLNAVKPRITELCKKYHKLEAVGKKKDFITGKMVATYKAVE